MRRAVFGADGQTFAVRHDTGIASGTAAQSGRYQNPMAATWRGGRSSLMNGGSNVQSNTSQSYVTQSQYMIHQTRVVSYANQANLDWEDAEPAIRKGLVNTISGLF